MSSKVLKRVKENARQFEEDRVNLSNAAASQSVPDESLFILDRAGSKSARRHVEKVLVPQQNNEVISFTEKKLIARIAASSPRKPYGTRWVNNKAAEAETVNDLWDNDGSSGDRGRKRHTTKTMTSQKRLRVAVPGQSYNPSTKDHQDALAQAVALQIKADDAIKSKDVEVLSALKVNSIKVIESDNDDNDEQSDTEKGQAHRQSKAQEKLTRAQRNKIKARNLANRKKDTIDAEKEMLKSIDEIPRIMQDLDRIDNSKMIAKAVVDDSGAGAVVPDPVTLRVDDISAVPLSDEMNGSLRAMIPKGVSISDRVNAMRSTGELSKPDRRKRRAYEKPHAAPNLAWHAKYKF